MIDSGHSRLSIVRRYELISIIHAPFYYMVKGESAFASALTRWKGREERSIRDQVAHEPIA